ncbi:MAG: hypothetical protein A2X86_12915 [Bdellovibrionales bacterium GWA2_49_15]|nr:MAG: hypothetical protein A2X86_12915 [Bdellovibrionales bacterium GWA2_49_15]HAZ13886.1 outer membrane lipoprotein-sorting protein [Bdellovibrionales bacterium]
MRTNIFLKGLALATILLSATIGTELRAEERDATIIIKKMQQAFFYQGGILRARVKMSLTTSDGNKRLRELTMLRINVPGGEDQRYFMYFHGPADVRRMAFLVYKYPNKESDRWLFIPDLGLVQRMASKDASSSFVGSDFTYEDVSGRNIGADSYKLIKEETYENKPTFVIESTPTTAAAYKRKISWIDQTAFLPLKEEFYDVQDQLFKVFTADEIKQVDGLPTITKRVMKNVKSGHQTLVEFAEIQYRVPLKVEDFSERALRNPPKEWIK